MKLSEAIREGAKRGPQHFGAMFGTGGASCALGAALGTKTGIWTEEEWRSDSTVLPLCGYWPKLAEEGIAPNGMRFDLLQHAIAYANDELLLSREQIADWLEEQGL